MNIAQGIRDFCMLTYNRRFLDEAGIRAYQLEKIKRLVEYATDKSVFYRTLYGGRPLDTIWDFMKLPIIDKQTMMDNFSELNTCKIDKEDVMRHAVEKELEKDYLGYYKGEYVVGLSSGTSGNKGIYVTPRELTERLPFVFLARSGLRLRNLPFRILFLLRVFSQAFDDINSPFVSLGYMSTMADPLKIVDALNKRRINVVMAPPSLMRVLIPYRDRMTTRIKQIVTYAEVLESEEKERLSRIFGADVIEIYQASEGQIASSCRCGNLHINEDLVFVELYDEDGNAVDKPGVVGSRMVITNMVNYAQPLIRYEMNDMVVLGGPCPCGSRFRTIERIIGRNDDVLMFTTESGEMRHVFPDLFARWIMTESDSIREFRVVQKSPDELIIQVDMKDGDDDCVERLRERILRELGDYGIFTEVYVVSESIVLPVDKAKYKRFLTYKRQ